VVLSAVFWWLQDTGQFIFPFMNRVSVVFVASLVAAIVVSLLVPPKPGTMQIRLDGVSYKTSLGFNIAGAGVIAFLIAVYWIWW
jgi:SSS family solute:Na+ symporter